MSETVLRNPFIPYQPTQRQAHFLALNDTEEVLYGGSAGGGKSAALLMAAAQYVHVPGYSALVLRRSYADLALPGAIMDVAKDWWIPLGVRWSDKEKTFHFPSGATITFGYLQSENDKYRYQGAEFQAVCFDELTQFTESQYSYLHSRCRRPAKDSERHAELARVPLRVRAATNPGGVGGDWVKDRFIPKEYLDADREERVEQEWVKENRRFVPARLEDNPHLDHDSYRSMLAKLDPITRAHLERGDWDVLPHGNLFQLEWFRSFMDMGDAYRVNDRVHAYPECWHFVIADPAGGVSKTSDLTVIMSCAVTPKNELLVTRVRRERIPFEKIVSAMDEECSHGPRPEFVGIESEFNFTSLTREAKENPKLPAVKPLYTEGKTKLIRSLPAMMRMESGQVFLPDWAEWLNGFKAELLVFTGSGDDEHDDQVDCLAYACRELDRGRVSGEAAAGVMVLK